VRGKVRVVALSDARIPWPLTYARNHRVPVGCGGLLEALRRESARAVEHWFGVSVWNSWKLRKGLGVPRANERTSHVHEDWMPERLAHRDPDRFRRANQAPTRRAKLAAAMRGRKLRPDAVAKLRATNVGKKHTAEARAKMSAAHRRRGTRPPAAGQPWTMEEEALLGINPDRIIAGRVGRRWKAVARHRKALGIPSYCERYRCAAALSR
jgi:Ni/Co efflux regulator RcnB